MKPLFRAGQYTVNTRNAANSPALAAINEELGEFAGLKLSVDEDIMVGNWTSQSHGIGNFNSAEVRDNTGACEYMVEPPPILRTPPIDGKILMEEPNGKYEKEVQCRIQA